MKLVKGCPLRVVLALILKENPLKYEWNDSHSRGISPYNYMYL